MDRWWLDLPWGDGSDAFRMKVINHFWFASLSFRNQVNDFVFILIPNATSTFRFPCNFQQSSFISNLQML